MTNSIVVGGGERDLGPTFLIIGLCLNTWSLFGNFFLNLETKSRPEIMLKNLFSLMMGAVIHYNGICLTFNVSEERICPIVSACLA